MSSSSSSVQSTRSMWALCVGIVLGGVILLGAMLLSVAAVKAATFTGVGDSGIYSLLYWGRAIASAGIAALVLLSAVRAGIRQYRA